MAELSVVGRIIQVLPIESGVKKNGDTWRKQGYVLETTESNYPRKIYFTFFNDRIEQNNLHVSDLIKLQFDIESREWNERWYTDIRGWRAEKVSDSNNIGPQPTETMSTSNNAFPIDDDNEKLPF